MSVPAVSVIMAVYNGAALLPETLASLRAQTLQDWELIAVDDCSTDDSVGVLERFGDPRVRVIRSASNGGPVVARNRAFAEVHGRYVAGLDQDDVSLPERFARQVGYLDAQPDVALVSCATDFLVEGKRLPGHWPRPLTPMLIDWLMLVQNPIAWSSVMFRADAARRLDPFERPAMRYVEDFDLYHRLRPFGRIAQIDQVLMLYRCHAGGASQMFNATMRAHAELLLRERHAALLGDAAADIAGLLVRHVMAREPVSDVETLNRLFDGIAALRTAFGGANPHEDLAAVDREISQLWWRICRASVRSGSLLLHRTLGTRPLPLGKAADLVASQMIGGVRAVKRGLTGRG
ncbi:glycosyltransferase family 2 protein [Sphingomonas psychrotolerans]|uniref:Glycosyl transferase family 2 n=1 Tax=Sphingomonas psychrotolerans TaxID=1327635 RepID=A0A2K8MDN6_9SPHN|nr:glycosyltransferase [Sphingomonas psychrotolerans]ATY31998.1 glycosyl transferase family 2 [Sphingomonas psychrotolerans]